MSEHRMNVWRPTADDIATSNVTALIERLGLEDYDELLAFSNAQPEHYWRTVVDFCGIVWDVDYHTYADLSAGKEFPKWFRGGQLNWVKTALKWADDPATVQQDAVVAEREDGSIQRVTYGELAQRVASFAAGLKAHGVKRGDRIGLLMENGVEATVTLLGIAWVGAVAVPLFSGFGVDAIVSRLSSCSARLLIATTGFSRRGKWVDTRKLVDEALTRLPDIDTVIWKRVAESIHFDAKVLDWREVADAQPDPEVERMSPEDPFMVIYTSGTTGKPKGAVHTHGGFPLKIAHDSAVHFNVKQGDVFCWPADMGWIAGSLVMSSALLRGATLVCYDGAPDFPDWSRMSRLIERHRITHFGSAPTLIRGLAANAGIAMQGDVSTVQLLITAGEGIDPEHFVWFQEAFGSGRRPVINYTGGTEVSGALLASVVVRPIVPSGFNTASPSVEVDVVGPTGESLVDRIGELSVHAPFVGMTQSFWQDNERYLDSYWRTIPGIWVHGDLAMHREDGHWFMLGRSDDTIKLAGKRVGPAEIEEVLLELPEIAEAAAIGVDDAVKGQKLVVFVIQTAGSHVSQVALEQSLAKHVDGRLGRPFRPSAVHVVAQLPKTRSSKIMRRVIRSVYAGQPPGDLSSLDNPGALDDIRRAAGR
ncbi:acetyl-CoA synthetase [Paraburkholderia sp. HC6.4b]|uniref:AMP-binding protein n=1 Tax=unclassified Paraburkholderia TaxID=2615204 RepID=UPI00184850DC|nr:MULTISPECIES: AMP-binding protein [unclassified Paraburkholderia]MBB5406382.1 acetyl-CoA synthetase [Paraburkholderia sp. HC6.4b]MBB5448780.1 acetyl-CoA synthetase [Paraburkholderia sp. Kb1A]